MQCGAIRRCFHHGSLEAIIAALHREAGRKKGGHGEREGSNGTDTGVDTETWAKRTLGLMENGRLSPTAMKLTLEILCRAAAHRSSLMASHTYHGDGGGGGDGDGHEHSEIFEEAMLKWCLKMEFRVMQRCFDLDGPSVQHRDGTLS